MTTIIPTPIFLLINVDLSFTYLIERYGQMCNCRVISTPTLDTARPIIYREKPALIVLDISSSDPSHWDIVRTLKADTSFRTVPIAACGAVTDKMDARKAGVDYWLSKPVMYDDFRAAVAATGALDRLQDGLDVNGYKP
jgi:chemotaxis family two-component system response regulator PixH